jgi:hypothetical protein
MRLRVPLLALHWKGLHSISGFDSIPKHLLGLGVVIAQESARARIALAVKSLMIRGLRGQLGALRAAYRAFDLNADGETSRIVCVWGRTPRVLVIASGEVTLDGLNEELLLHESLRHAAVRGQEIGRNEPCPCSSGKKYKKCHGVEFQPGRKYSDRISINRNAVHFCNRHAVTALSPWWRRRCAARAWAHTRRRLR